jgi:hypothetical protein
VPVDIYHNKSVEELTSLLSSLQLRQSKGSITEVSAAGVRTVRAVNASDPSIERQIIGVLYSLSQKAVASGDTALIAQWPNPYANRVRRTIPSYLS